jgi:hypothetical protein
MFSDVSGERAASIFYAEDEGSIFLRKVDTFMMKNFIICTRYQILLGR